MENMNIRIARELNKIARELVAEERIANHEGCYRKFTGTIDWRGIKGQVKNATFDLYTDYFNPILWYDGTWEKGAWNRGTWLNGTWKNGSWGNPEGGTWKKGVWENGTWYGGFWEGGTWKNGVFKGGWWINGVWEKVIGQKEEMNVLKHIKREIVLTSGKNKPKAI